MAIPTLFESTTAVKHDPREWVPAGGVEMIYKQYMEIKDVHKVARIHGVCGETVRKYLNKNGCRLLKSDWSERDIRDLKDYYINTPDKEFSCEKISRRLGRSVNSVSIKAGRMGLGNWHRKKKARIKITQPNLPWSLWVKNAHPRGFLGGHHTVDSKAKISAKAIMAWERAKATGTGSMSEENLQKKSDNMIIRNAARMKFSPGSIYSRCGRGRRADIGDQFFRSKWEANYARYLNFLKAQGKILRWEYEVDTFWFLEIKRGVRSYTPDFKVWESESEYRYDEVKGWMDKKSATKLNRMRIYYPSVKIELVDEKRYRALAVTARGIVKGWEA